MLDLEDGLEFNPNEIEMAASQLDINLDDGPPKPKPIEQMSLAEQLAARRAEMNAAAAGGNEGAGEAAKPPPPKSKYPLDKDGNVDLSRMSLAE